jgi:two-component system response regulator YesN
MEIVGECSSGSMAVEMCCVLKPDLAFINCGMGAISGIAAAARIRRDNKNIAIVLTSADENSFRYGEGGETPASIGVLECLLKPIKACKIEDIAARCEIRDNPSRYVPSKVKKYLRFPPPDTMSAQISKAVAFLDTHYMDEVDLESVAGSVFLSKCHFCRLFKQETGVNFSQYILHKRLEVAKRILGETEESITNISVAVGFQGYNYFDRIFKKHTGLTPSEYRNRLQIEKKEREGLRNERRFTDPSHAPLQ